MIELKDEKEIK